MNDVKAAWVFFSWWFIFKIPAVRASPAGIRVVQT